MYETYIKWLMNPFYDLNAPIKSQVSGLSVEKLVFMKISC